MCTNWNNTNQFWCYGGKKYPSYGEKLITDKKFQFHDGVHIGLIFDFVNKNCDLFCDGEKVTTIFPDILAQKLPQHGLRTHDREKDQSYGHRFGIWLL